MTELLAYLGLGTKKEYHQWCRAHHPDRNHGDPIATHRFQIVSGAWTKVHRLEVAPELTEEERVALLRRGKCGVHVRGVSGEFCHRRPLKGSDRCFYHQPGTAHMAFVDDDDPSRVFGLLHDFRRERDDDMCTARLGNGKFCTGFRAKERSLYCRACSPRRRRFNSV